MAVWVVRGGRKGDREEAALVGDFVAMGWNELPDLAAIQDWESLKTLYRQKANRDDTPAQIANGVGQVWKFRKLIEPGHLVVLPRLLKARHKEVAIGKVIGTYHYRNDLAEGIHHTIAVRWLCKGILRASFDQDLQKRFNLQPTVYQIRLDDAEERIQAVFSASHTRPPIANDEHWKEGTTDLSRVLEGVRGKIAKLMGTNPSEEGTKAALINPVLRALGWNVENPDHVLLEDRGKEQEV